MSHRHHYLLEKKPFLKSHLMGNIFSKKQTSFKAFKNNQEYFSFFSFSLFVARSSPAGPANCTKNNWDHKIFLLKLTIIIDQPFAYQLRIYA